MSQLLAQAQPYINFKENVLVEDVENNKTYMNPKKKHREDKDKKRNMGPQSNFSLYTPIENTRE